MSAVSSKCSAASELTDSQSPYASSVVAFTVLTGPLAGTGLPTRQYPRHRYSRVQRGRKKPLVCARHHVITRAFDFPHICVHDCAYKPKTVKVSGATMENR